MKTAREWISTFRKARLRYAMRELWKIFPQLLYGRQLIVLDYPVIPSSRYGNGKPPHRELHSLLAQGNLGYASYLNQFLTYTRELTRIPKAAPDSSREPRWVNRYLPALDAICLYGFIRIFGPNHIVEIGSGNSTKFSRKAIADQGLATRITSIDPHPRAEVDQICDEIIRLPLENVDLSLFDNLQSGDIVFFDGSHRIFTNSDVAVFFLEVLPRLAPGVLVQIHDICLPADYPLDWDNRYYSEQYMLAAHLLARGSTTEVLMPARFVSDTPELHNVLLPIWSDPRLAGIESHGCSFWMRKR